MTIHLTDDDVQDLIALTKNLLRKHNVSLSKPSRGKLSITSTTDQSKFCLDYFIRPGKASLNFRELVYNYCIIRINLNEGFHKNADDKKVFGNRINIFSADEFHDKGDSKTYMKAFSLPYSSFKDSSDPEVQLIQLLDFTNTYYQGKLTISPHLF
ncbi:DUF6978 family protein [Lacicoccus alkaliphilus]|uniref:Uncharacterized protein n=1 Tax=Lacicoccus alkaliphilus DSM 16010 TaxID=1123231 RepID=A0A1M7FXD6_9BACL|nr:hypothetical protein [Salinicoccus alkaliphilus]SHM08792.1 hypothetical protein SAMN02745189_01517 [Salinicoccus alkaliphilus DSM 16010]